MSRTPAPRRFPRRGVSTSARKREAVDQQLCPPIEVHAVLSLDGKTQLRGSDDTNDGNEANEKSIFDQRRAFLVLTEGIHRLKSIRHFC
jgi:hypothetical protein